MPSEQFAEGGRVTVHLRSKRRVAKAIGRRKRLSGCLSGLSLSWCSAEAQATPREARRFPRRRSGLMSEAENIEIVRRFYDQVFDRQNLELADTFVAPQFKNHTAPP